MTQEETQWKKLAEDALAACEAFHMFWSQGFGNAYTPVQEYKEAVAKYQSLGGTTNFNTEDS
jgi:hypothetical protein